MKVLSLKSLQEHMPASDESSKRSAGKMFQVAFWHRETHQDCSLLEAGYMKNAHESRLNPEGKIQSEYFGLAMAICAVGLLRKAYICSEAFANKFLQEVSPNNAEDGLLCPVNCVAPVSEVFKDIEKDPSDKNADQKVTLLEAEISELKMLRSEAFKANERVVSIFASKEQEWHIERKRLIEEQHKLYKELQRTFLQCKTLESQMERLKVYQKRPSCMDCEHREGLFVKLKDRLEEQEFQIMTTAEEAQSERLEKNALAEKLAAAELSLSHMQKKLSVEAENHASALAVRDELVKQLEDRAKEAAIETDRIQQELHASQARIIVEKNHREEAISVVSKEINQLKASVHDKDFVISAMLKKAKADSGERTELENELALMKMKLDYSEREKQKWRRIDQLSSVSSFKDDVFKSRSSTESRSLSISIKDLQILNDAEVKDLRTVFEEQIQMLQKRLTLYKERVADLEEDILMRMTQTKVMVKDSNHFSSKANILDKKCLAALSESLEAELATKQFQLSVAKALIKQFMDLETHREEEVERWKKLYFASKATLAFHEDEQYPGFAMVANHPKPSKWSEALIKSRYMYELEKKHWQEIDAFERQMRARDERMEAFRRQLLHMREELQRADSQIEILKQDLDTAQDARRTLEEILVQREDELVACKQKHHVQYKEDSSQYKEDSSQRGLPDFG